MYNNKYILPNSEPTRDIDEVQDSLSSIKKSSESISQRNILSGIRENYNRIYQSMDDQSEVWDKAIIAASDSDFALARLLRANKSKMREDFADLHLLINAFTSSDIDEEQKIQLLESAKSNACVKSIGINKNTLTITKVDGTKISVEILSQKFPALKGNPQLVTNKRLHKCHYGAISLARLIKNNATVVTGKTLGITTSSHYVHSWVEATIDGKPVVIDFTMNAIINKDGFYSLRHAEPITKIHNSELDADFPIIAPHINSGDLKIKEYLVYRDQVLELLNVNQSE